MHHLSTRYCLAGSTAYLEVKNNPRPKKYGYETIIERGLGRLASGIIKHSVIVLLIPVLAAGVGYSLVLGQNL